MATTKCDKYNCTLPADHDGWHIKKGPRGKIIISWLNGEWKMPDGQTGTYSYVEQAEVAVIQDMKVPEFPGVGEEFI